MTTLNFIVDDDDDDDDVEDDVVVNVIDVWSGIK